MTTNISAFAQTADDIQAYETAIVTDSNLRAETKDQLALRFPGLEKALSLSRVDLVKAGWANMTTAYAGLWLDPDSQTEVLSVANNHHIPLQ